MTSNTTFLQSICMRFGVLFLLLLPLPVQAQLVELTPEEQAYLDELGEITMCVDPDWEPYERMDAQGNFTGIAADLIEIVSQRLNIPFVIEPTAEWGETLQVSRDGGCMLIPFLNQTQAREEWLIFTEPLFTNPNVFITRNEHDYISDPAALVDRTVVLPHGTSMEEHLRRDYPNLNIISVEDENECYRMVSAGEADMTLRSLTIAAYTIRKDGWFNLKIAGQPPQDHYMNRLRMGVLKEMPELRDILGKAISTITPRERDLIVNEHVNIVVETPLNYTRLYQIAGGVILVLLGIVFWNVRLRQLRNSLSRVNVDLRQAIEKVTESEELFRNVVESTPFALSIITLQGQILYASPRARELFEVGDAADLSSVKVPNLWAKAEDRDRYISELRNKGMVMNYEAEMRTSSGRPFWILASGKIIAYKGQQCVLTNQHEITERKQIEDALRESERTHRIIFENSPLGMFYLDASGTIVACNDQFVRLMGSSRDKLIGFNLTTRPVPSIQDIVLKALAGEQSLYEGLYTSVTGGKTSYLRMIANPVQPSVSPTPVIATVEDITERKRIEEAVAVSEKRLQQLAEQSRTVTWVVDSQGLYTFISPVAEKVFGYQPEELVNRKHFYDLTPENEREAIKTLGLEAIRNATYLQSVENAVMAKDGSIVWVLSNGMPLLGEDGQVVGYQGLDMDITERKRVETALKISEQRYRHISENTGDVIWKLDLRTHRFTYISPSVLRLRGYTPEEIMAQPVEASMTPESYELISKSLPRRIEALLNGDESARVQTGNVDQPCKDGRIVHTEVVTTLISDDQGRIVESLGVSRDVTERRRAEEALRQALLKADQATRAKSEFLANMSHEIRTPMNAIIGMSHLALRTDMNPKQQGYLKKIDGAARSLLGIINDILDFSKIEAGKLEMEHVPFNLEDVLTNLASIVGIKAEEKNLELVFLTAPETPLLLKGDSMRLGQVLVNLVNNAVKFTERGEIVVCVSPVPPNGDDTPLPDDDHVRLLFSVRDTGSGMDPEQLSRLFQAFSQADASITRKHGGTGLGLAISKQLVEMMGGGIQVQSEPGKGSTFSFTVCLELAPCLGRENVRDRTLSNLSGKRVLVVDDIDSARVVLTDMLDAFGMPTSSASSAAQALSMIRDASSRGAPYDLVFMDWRLPDINGIEAARRVRSDAALTKVPEIVLVTAFGREEVIKQAGEMNMGLLLKPVSQSMLLDAMGQALQSASHLPSCSATRSPSVHSPDASVEHLAGRRVLLVEDNALNRDLATELLTDLGVTVDVAVNGLEAVLLAGAVPFDLIFMDIQMPEMDGYEATRKIRKHEIDNAGMLEYWNAGIDKKNDRGISNSDGRDVREMNSAENTSQHPRIPIIAMTAHAMAGDREKSLEAGMDDHLTKPIDPDMLRDALLRWMPQERSQESEVGSQEPEFGRRTSEVGDRIFDPQVSSLSPQPSLPPPFDSPAALERCNGNHVLLLKLVLVFGREYADALPRLHGLLKDGQFTEAQRLAHSLKGVSATLDVQELTKAAASVELALANGLTDNLDDLFQSLEAALTPAVEAALALAEQGEARASAPADAAEAAKHRPLSPETLISLNALRKLLQTNSIKARKTFTGIREELLGRGMEDDVTTLESNLERLDFEGALEIVERIEAGLSEVGV